MYKKYGGIVMLVNRRDMKDVDNGITLIALVITIIILLILAGVSLNLVFRENGIINKAQDVAEISKKADIKEKIRLDILEEELKAKSEGKSGIEENELNKIIEKYGELQEDKDTIITKDGYEISLNEIWGGKVGETDKIALDGSYSDINKVNRPKLEGTGLIPIEINEDGNTKNVNMEKEEWYSYDGQTNHWANAQTAEGSMWVWIPRYAYKINEDKSIDVVFLKDITDMYEENGIQKDAKENGYIVHPAFEDGSQTGYPNGEWDKKISGFWMAKFEAGYAPKEEAVDSNLGYSTIYSQDSNTSTNFAKNYYGARQVGTKIKYPTFTANKPSVNHISISDAYDICRELTSQDNPYKLKNIDSHLTKNSEWGAVAYLTQSKYGRNKEKITLNNVTVNGENTVYSITGYAATEIGAPQNITTIQKVNTHAVENSYEWMTTKGQKASSTGNVYGIYDLSGGAYEETAGYLVGGSNYTTYGQSLVGDSTKYKSKYEGTSNTDTENYAHSSNVKRVGEAIWETSTNGTGRYAWNGEDTRFIFQSSPFILKGNSYAHQSESGIFSFGRNWGYGNYCIGYRCILIP